VTAQFDSTVSSPRRPKLSLAAALVIFVAPVIAAWLVFSNMDAWGPKGTTNRGDLVIPARPLEGIALRRLDGAPLDLDFFKGLWTLVYIDSTSCDEACQTNLYKIRQIRLAQGENMERVQRLFVLTDTAKLDELQPLLAQHPGLVVATGEPLPLDRFVEQFELQGSAPADSAQRAYIVDPLGNLMMSYEPGADPKDLLKDLERLLKVSQIG
jgi:cytochrome oxidase Cu insertion factor (SCO1/SenC/PrrC family)